MRLWAVLLLTTAACAQQTHPPAEPPQEQAARFRHDQLLKAIDDLMWHRKLGDIAEINKVSYTSLPPTKIENPKAPGATNPLIIRAYTFIPRKLDRSGKHPLIVLPHGGVHSNFSTGSAHIVR
jgi:hypothetical protein